MEAMLLSIYIAQSLSFAQKGYWDNFCIACGTMARELAESTNETISFLNLMDQAERIVENS